MSPALQADSLPLSHVGSLCTIKQTLKYMQASINRLKGEVDKFTIIFGKFNPSFSVFDTMSRQKISKNIDDLGNTYSNHLI